MAPPLSTDHRHLSSYAEKLLKELKPDGTSAKKKPPPSRWLTILELIDTHVTELAHQRQLWNGFRSVVENSRVHQSQPIFFHWVFKMYADAHVMAVRRMTDTDARSGSFTVLLREMEANPKGLTRQWFLSDLDADFICSMDAQFTKYADSNAPNRLNPDLPREDLARLIALSERIEAYVNKYVAHADLEAKVPTPTVGELDKVAAELEDLLRKYSNMLQRVDRIAVAPFIQSTWQAVFYEPWAKRTSDLGGDSASGLGSTST